MKKSIIIITILFSIITVLVYLSPGSHKDYIKASKLYISEIMASNSYTIKDEDGDYSDYIEIYNGYNHPINLKDYYLSDDEFNTNKWMFSNITIEPKKYILIFASSKNKENHTNFKLNKDGETITLTDKTGNIISKVSYEKMQNDISYGYSKNKYIYTSYPTPNKKNSNIKLNKKNIKYDIYINEYMSNNKNNNYNTNGYYYDWVELYNNSNKDIILKNLYLTDDKKSLNKYKLPEININKKSHIIIYLSGNPINEENNIHANFKISSGEQLILSNGENIIDQVKIVELKENVSYGRKENEWYYFTMPTPGKTNDTASFSKLGE